MWLLFRLIVVSSLSMYSLSTPAESPLSTALESNQPIKIGMSAAFSGPASHLGEAMKQGIEAYFNHINLSGGIQQRPLLLVALDDGYEPERTILNVESLLDQQVVSLLGNVGTPTSVTILPLLNEYTLPLVGAYTGSSALRNSTLHPYVFNYRASYAQETKRVIDALLDSGIRADEIVVFSQNDSYGDAGYLGVEKALKERNHSVDSLLHVRYSRNKTNIEVALAETLIEKEKVKAFIMIGAYEPVAKFINKAKTYYPTAKYFNVSFVGAEALAKRTQKHDNLYVTQVVPDLQAQTLPIIEAFHQDFEQLFPKKLPSVGALEGYISAKILVKGLKQITGKITSGALIEALNRNRVIDIGMLTRLTLQPDTHQYCHSVWLSKLQKGQVVYLDWKALKYD